jgi:hemolysin D
MLLTYVDKPVDRSAPEPTEEPMLLERPKFLSHLYLWLIVGIAGAGLGWSAIAEIEQAVSAMGQLEPKSSTQEVKAPTGGVVREVYVQDGQTVKKGQLLLRFDPTAAKAELKSLTQLKASLLRENTFYTTAVSNGTPAGQSDLAVLTELRNNLVQENQAYQAQLTGVPLPKASDAFSTNQQQLLSASLAEDQSRMAATQLKGEELQKQLNQAHTQLATAQKSQAIVTGLRDRLKPLAAAGGISQVQLQQQEQDVLKQQGEVERLQGEVQRLTVAIAQSQEQLQQTRATADKELLAKIANNQNRIAELDSQLSRIRLENQKKLSELDGQISKANLALRYQDLRSPADGFVFNLQPRSAGFVANGTQPLLSVVPKDNLIASVYLKNKDIGFVKPGMDVDVKLESFPEQEFGTIRGKLLWVGSDVLPPTQARPFPAFPAKIQLDKQQLKDEHQPLFLQSGMAVTCNIKIRKRTVLNLFLEMFDTKVKGLETVR